MKGSENAAGFTKLRVGKRGSRDNRDEDRRQEKCSERGFRVAEKENGFEENQSSRQYVKPLARTGGGLRRGSHRKVENQDGVSAETRQDSAERDGARQSPVVPDSAEFSNERRRVKCEKKTR